MDSSLCHPGGPSLTPAEAQQECMVSPPHGLEWAVHWWHHCPCLRLLFILIEPHWSYLWHWWIASLQFMIHVWVIDLWLASLLPAFRGVLSLLNMGPGMELPIEGRLLHLGPSISMLGIILTCMQCTSAYTWHCVVDLCSNSLCWNHL